jgi:hypothetical protein
LYSSGINNHFAFEKIRRSKSILGCEPAGLKLSQTIIILQKAHRFVQAALENISIKSSAIRIR